MLSVEQTAPAVRPLLLLREAADMIGVSEPTMRRLVHRGEVRPHPAFRN